MVEHWSVKPEVKSSKSKIREYKNLNIKIMNNLSGIAKN